MAERTTASLCPRVLVYPGSMPRLLATILWLCFTAKVVFYASFVPLWEGYDEFSHFAFVEHLAANHSLPDLRNSATPKDVAESLRSAPVPWTIRGWKSDWTTHDEYWRLTPEVRQQREKNVVETPLSVTSDPTLNLYEAQQPPLAYIVFSLPYATFRNSSLV